MRRDCANENKLKQKWEWGREDASVKKTKQK